ncbi:MAG: GNAT family N-acetyltransferase [Gammaproteobacteria bacterium]|nr:GNAT family N-acetyltransferase [Gammaproteobacteria bacterium]
MADQGSADGLRVEVVDGLGGVTAAAWNALGADPYPFLRHEFLRALELDGCVGERYGWLPRHLLAYRAGRLVGAAPLYLKRNSYGEFVFDWSWADAYRRAGVDYYPKLVSAAPYTPATGPKLLVAPDTERDIVRRALADAALDLAHELGVSSLHWLFGPAEETDWLVAHGFARRLGCQFHWANAGYGDFDDFLQTFSAEKRKKVKRERRRVVEQGIGFRVLHAGDVSAAEWRFFHRLYADTFHRRGGIPTLSLEFFQRLGRDMPGGAALVLALHGDDPVAAAFSLVGTDTLYGRHWGCREAYHSLHFEACYYQGIDYCLRHGLARFEPGAQGEHKLSRGFLPTATWSAHWIAHPAFAAAVDRFLALEGEAMRDYLADMAAHSPYKADDPGATAAR